MSINKGRVAIVTGAGQGIGAGVARSLAEAGAYVAVCDINEASANAMVQSLLDDGYEAMAVVGDVGSTEGCQQAVAKVLDKWGHIDILVNNAGINRDAMVYKMTEDQWDLVLRIDLKGPFLMTQAVCLLMKEQGFGRIINVSSPAWKGNFGQSNYAAAKAGILGLTYTNALELGKYGVTVNSLCPGYIDTPMSRSVPEQFFQRAMSLVPCGQIGKPSDIGNLVCFFASEEAGYINGQTINVDAGMHVGLKD